jgi:hypothetical protein
MSINLQVFFEDPFWVGLFTAADDSCIKVCRVIFGKEPADAEVYEYLQKNFYSLRFIESESVNMQKSSCVNPKRRQRQISRELHDSIGRKKSYEIIKQAITQSSRKAKRLNRKNEKEQHSEYIMELKRIKRREKHRGR